MNEFAANLQSRRDPWGETVSVLRFLAAVAAVFICFVILFTEILVGVRVEQGSMEPTLHDGDYVFVDRTRDPQRGDIIVIYSERGSDSKYVIKRLIGLPGDVVYAENGVLYRIDAGTEGSYVVQEPYLTEDWKQTLDPVTVPEGEVFVLGDHRSVSNDSRPAPGSLGTLPLDGLLGVVTDFSLQHKTFFTRLFGIFA